MTSHHTVLLLGATGRTGGRVLTQLLDRGVPVRAIVRDAGRLPDGVSGHPLLTVVEADVVAVPVGELGRHLDGCDTVISCLGHTVSLRGVLGPPRDLVTRALRNVCGAIEARQPERPVRVILMGSVSVNQPDHADTRRGLGERAFLSAVRVAIPPAKDNQAAADYLARQVGAAGRIVEWVVVRPDTLRDGDVSDYRTSPEIVSSLFRPGSTRMANVAHFMCELTTDDSTWVRWRYAMPVVTDAA